jgi:hypothetical protein
MCGTHTHILVLVERSARSRRLYSDHAVHSRQRSQRPQSSPLLSPHYSVSSQPFDLAANDSAHVPALFPASSSNEHPATKFALLFARQLRLETEAAFAALHEVAPQPARNLPAYVDSVWCPHLSDARVQPSERGNNDPALFEAIWAKLMLVQPDMPKSSAELVKLVEGGMAGFQARWSRLEGAPVRMAHSSLALMRIPLHLWCRHGWPYRNSPRGPR